MNTIQNYGTNYQNSNSQKNVAFGAKFSLKDIETLISEQHKFGENPLPEYPKLYTFLERLAEIPGNIAKLTKGKERGGGWSSPTRNPIIEIDRKIFRENHGGERGYYWFDTLRDAILDGNPNTSQIPTFGMPNSVYQQTWWKHRNVTPDDIRKLAYDA